MCGIAGAVDLHARRGADELNVIASEMADVLAHRGPDDSGTWVDEQCGVALGFRRLSILDLSDEGKQPMVSKSGRYVCIFNGEIYNFRLLRRQLQDMGHVFRGQSDTEVLVEALDEWGVAGSLAHLNGMFAIAIWDREQEAIHLIRDRMGEKPLYYGRQRDVFVFASELKALERHPDFVPEIDRNVLALYVRFNYIPAPYSIYSDVRKLAPGSHLTVNLSRRVERLSSYWSLPEVASRGAAHPLTGSEEVVLDDLDSLLRDSVRLRMESDVPLGAMLSGGIDSSLIAAMMQDQSSSRIKTFTIGFTEDEYNEAPHAAAVADYLKTDHTELYVTPQEAMRVIPLLPSMYDEPFGDVSQIPTHLVSRLAREKVTVALSGDGGDELFAGYNRYLLTPRIWKQLKRLPSPVRSLLERGMRSKASPTLAKIAAGFGSSGGNLAQGQPGSRLLSLARVMTATDHEDMYVRLLTRWDASIVRGAETRPTWFDADRSWRSLPDPVQRVMLLDGMTYLPDDILVKMDRATMATSLEGRMPLLDHRVVEYAWRIRLSQKIRDGRGKWILRRLLHRYVPKQLVERPKMGFGVPIESWLRRPLREWAGDLLSSRLIRSDGFFDPVPIEKRWRQHLSGERDWHYELWTILMFQAWLHPTETANLRI